MNDELDPNLDPIARQAAELCLRHPQAWSVMLGVAVGAAMNNGVSLIGLQVTVEDAYNGANKLLSKRVR